MLAIILSFSKQLSGCILHAPSTAIPILMSVMKPPEMPSHSVSLLRRVLDGETDKDIVNQVRIIGLN